MPRASPGAGVEKHRLKGGDMAAQGNALGSRIVFRIQSKP